jgi:hypothetical protein
MGRILVGQDTSVLPQHAGKRGDESSSGERCNRDTLRQ